MCKKSGWVICQLSYSSITNHVCCWRGCGERNRFAFKVGNCKLWEKWRSSCNVCDFSGSRDSETVEFNVGVLFLPRAVNMSAVSPGIALCEAPVHWTSAFCITFYEGSLHNSCVQGVSTIILYLWSRASVAALSSMLWTSFPFGNMRFSGTRRTRAFNRSLSSLEHWIQLMKLLHMPKMARIGCLGGGSAYRTYTLMSLFHIGL